MRNSQSLILIISFIYLAIQIQAQVQPGIEHWQPVIGIFAQPSEDLQKFYDPNKGYSYIAASYVKWIEAAGARVVPIPYNIPTVEELDFILDRVNGILMPGGDASLWQNETTKNAFSNQTWVGQRIFEKAKEFNKASPFSPFPLWATCMSYEMILLIVTQNPKILDNFDSNNHALNTTIVQNVSSNLYNNIPVKYWYYIENDMSFYYNHMYGLKPENFYSNKNLTDMFKLTSYSTYKNQTFVATLEGRQFPFILSQYHPEKNAFEWLESINANHNAAAIANAQFESEYFISLARQNSHRMTFDEMKNLSIYNYPAVNTLSWNEGFVQTYFFQASNNTNIPPSYIKNKTQTINLFE